MRGIGHPEDIAVQSATPQLFSCAVLFSLHNILAITLFGDMTLANTSSVALRSTRKGFVWRSPHGGKKSNTGAAIVRLRQLILNSRQYYRQ